MHGKGPDSAGTGRWSGVSPAAVRADALRSDSQQHAAVALHRGAGGVPVGVLTRDVAVVLDEPVDRLGEVDDLGPALDLRGGSEEAVLEHAHRAPRLALNVLRLHPRLAGPDPHGAAAVDAHRDRGEPWPAV